MLFKILSTVRSVLFLSVFFWILLGAGSPASAISYQVVDLGAYTPNISSHGMDINNGGTVAGFLSSSGISSSFIYSGGSFKVFGPLSGHSWSQARAVNSSGQVAGTSGDSSGAKMGYLYSGGVVTPLGTLPGGSSSVAFDINDAGEIVGYSSSSLGTRGFIYSGGVMSDLGSLDGGTWVSAKAINNLGQVVGVSEKGGVQSAFLYEGGVMKAVGTLPGGTSSVALDINDSGQIVGWSDSQAGRMAFFYDGSVMTGLGILQGGSWSEAYGVNSFGHVVGRSNSSQGWSRAFLYRNGVLYDLNSLIPQGSGWVLQSAFAINDVGYIVGTGKVNSRQHAFMLTPVSNSPSNVPEPSAIVLFGSSLMVMALLRCRPLRRRG
ncbi:MAG TPA: DUF3466 family protein [Deltaproteobacteria bacterium]|nr:DUF3466 family protein [Deltaproteobacteria bacterium]